MTKKYIKFVKAVRGWDIYSKRGKGLKDLLGYIELYPKWNRLVFNTYHGTVWTSECLQQIVDFLKEQENEI